MKPEMRRTPTQRRGHARVELILSTAAAMIAENGVASFSIRALAKRADISLGTLYRYFDGLDAVVDTLLVRRIAGIRDRLVNNYFNSDPVSIASLSRDTFAAHVSFYRAYPNMVDLWFGGRSNPAVQRRFRQRSDEASALFDGLLRDARFVDELPASVVSLGTEVLDRIVDFAFRAEQGGSDEVIEHGIHLITASLDRFATAEGREGVSNAEFVTRLEAAGSPVLAYYRQLHERPAAAVAET